jgi:hypothetical protein
MHRCATLLVVATSVARLAYREAISITPAETTAHAIDAADACA